jgi:hypothetical protein
MARTHKVNALDAAVTAIIGASKGKPASTKATREANDARIGALIADAGDSIGVYTVGLDLDQASTISSVEAAVRDAIALGLTCDKESATGDMLKAPSKTNPGELWTVFVDAINAPRMANGLPELAKGARDNYLSRIRAFVRARGADSLDLYGNIQAAKLRAAAAAKQPAAVNAGDDDATGDDTTPVSAHVRGAAANDESTYTGAAALAAFLSKFVDANPKDSASIGFCTIIGAVEDLLEETQAFIALTSKGK